MGDAGCGPTTPPIPHLASRIPHPDISGGRLANEQVGLLALAARPGDAVPPAGCDPAALAKYGPPGEHHRPFKILPALAYREDPVKPSLVVDISETFEAKMRAIRCYASQFDGSKAAGEIHPTGQDLYELIRVQSAHYGSLIRKPYGEPYFCYETLEVQDVLQLGVQSL